jgi:hypothetical protein
MLLKFLAAGLLAGSLQSCNVIKFSTKGMLTDGPYRFRHKGEKFQKVRVEVAEDTILIRAADDAHVITKPGDKYFLVRALDVDLLAAPFKYRPGISGMPRQLNSSFNGNVFVGYRWDRFKWHRQNNSLHNNIKISHTAVSIGGFAGIGSSAINPWTTNYQIAEEYDGFIVTKGVAGLIGLQRFTAGLAVGFDALTDRDKDVWIYQNKPWYGIVIGVNIN